MNEPETRAILTLSVMAAFADGDKHEREREALRRVAQGLMDHEQVNLPTLYQDVLMKRVALPQVVAQLVGPDARRLAYEMAVCVCDADGAQSPAEQAFLGELRGALGLDAASASRIDTQAQALAEAPLVPLPVQQVGATQGAGTAAAVDEAALDDAILKAAILNGALELLPETLATLAIIPLQTRLVYQVGKTYGYQLDGGHVKDFLATAGVGLTSQCLEQAGRKLLGGLLGKVGGGLLRGVGRQAVSSGMSFATTYALGHVAKRYYAGGRQLSGAMLKDSFAALAGKAQGLQGQYLPQMQAQARSLDLGKLLATVRSPGR